jgi:hypothetical protein
MPAFCMSFAFILWRLYGTSGNDATVHSCSRALLPFHQKRIVFALPCHYPITVRENKHLTMFAKAFTIPPVQWYLCALGNTVGNRERVQ